MAIVAIAAISCNDFLKEDPKTFLSPDNYFTTEAQMQSAVNGLYRQIPSIFNGDVEVGTQRFIFLEYMTGYGRRPRSATTQYLTQANLLTVSEENNNLESMWQSAYNAIENCNNVIAGITSSTANVADDAKNVFLGEAYFLRAYYYFTLVRLWEDVPLKTTPTLDLSENEIPLSSAKDVYLQIESDLLNSEELMGSSAWNRIDGHVSKGAVKSLLAKVYITMAGYPLQLGTEYYKKAYEKAKEVVASKAFSLFTHYSGLTDYGNANSGEFIFSIQRDADRAGSPVHQLMLPYPYPEKEISSNPEGGGAIAPTLEFYNSFADDDQRKAEKGFFYTKMEAKDGSGMVEFDTPYIYKWWDNSAAQNGKSGINYPLIRYADILLIEAEAKTQADGGSTSDASAIDAYYAVRHRAFPSESRPPVITFNEVYKERIFELCFETQTWYDMLRTRKALNTSTGEIVDLIGYQTPGHAAPFAAKDLVFPYPIREKRLNPNLVR